MNKITHDGKEYEVLPLDRISEITHAKLAGGKVRKCLLRGIDNKFVEWNQPSRGGAYINDFEDLGIQPLKLLPKTPVECKGKVVGCQHKPEFETVWLTIEVAEGTLLPDYYSLVKVETVEVTE